MLSLGASAGIVAIVYIILELLKNNVALTDKQRDMLPLAGVVIGALVAVAIHFFDPTGELGIVVSDNLLVSVLMGAGSGLVATGCNQLLKKYNKLAKGDYSGIDPGLDNVLDSMKDLDEDENPKQE